MAEGVVKPVFVLRNIVNSFHYLYQDAEYFHGIAQKPEVTGTFEAVRMCRTALLLYVFSLKGLINRALDHFLPQHLHDFFLEKEDRFRLEDKWQLLPLVAGASTATFDTGQYPWSHFKELLRLRNDFVHPKHDRAAYYRAVTSHAWEPLSWKAIPEGLGVRETDVVYRQTRIPRDPYAVRLEHVDIAKTVVDDTVARLDALLGGKVLAENWLRTEKLELVYPPEAGMDDLTILDGMPADEA